MKTKLFIALAVFISLNFGANLPTQVEAKEPKTITKDFNREMFRRQAAHKFGKIVTFLETRVHRTAYVFSGDQVSGWDCSGMVRWAYQQVGITLPHSANKQGHLGRRVSIPKRGDIVVFAYPGQTDFNHAAIYLGQGLIIDANFEYKTTVIEPLTNFSNNQIRFVRVF
jgi:cell wall-associated NlpC family hydrolase